MKRLTDILLLPLSIVTLIGCSKNNNQSMVNIIGYQAKETS